MLLATFLFALLVLLKPNTSHAACPPFQLPAPDSTMPTAPKTLPNPFTFLSGAKVESKPDWQCRRTELIALMEHFEFGALPAKASILNATFTDSKLIIDVQEGDRKISFTAKIQFPTNFSENASPFPAIIAINNANIPLNNTGITVITYNADELAQRSDTSSRGKGKFYDLHGSQHSAGILTAWTWGISRIVDALELLGPEITHVDTNKLGLTGCSYNGRAALIASALEPRIALTIPQEAGVGGPACWRLYNSNPCRTCPLRPPPGQDLPWYRREFADNIENDLYRLPYDRHELIGLIAPRGLLIVENNIDWLEPLGSNVCANAGRAVYEALDVKEAFGFSLSQGHMHCTLPEAQVPQLKAFLDRYLLKGNLDTDIWESVRSEEADSWGGWNWTVPELD
jgi:hypothetical protein